MENRERGVSAVLLAEVRRQNRPFALLVDSRRCQYWGYSEFPNNFRRLILGNPVSGILTFAVIFFTLVVQGLSLPTLIRRLEVSDGGADADEEVRARLVATEAALEELDALAGEEWSRDETVEHMRTLYDYRKRRFAARAGKIEDQGYEDRSPTSALRHATACK